MCKMRNQLLLSQIYISVDKKKSVHNICENIKNLCCHND